MRLKRSKHLIFKVLSVAALGGVVFTSSASVTDFFSVTPELSAPHDAAALYRIFMTGEGPYDSSMDGKLYPYPLTQSGSLGGMLYNGCYDDRNIRISDLDADNTCASTIASRPGASINRLFMGYKINCADSTTTPGQCKDASLLINCELTQVQNGSGTNGGYSPQRYCSTGDPIIRRAKGKSNNGSGVEGCLPGKDGTSYPSCNACPDGYYNESVGLNTSACVKCTIPVISGQSTANGPTQMVTNAPDGR